MKKGKIIMLAVIVILLIGVVLLMSENGNLVNSLNEYVDSNETYQRCVLNSHEEYTKKWNEYCVVEGEEDDCSLDRSLAYELEVEKRNDYEKCYSEQLERLNNIK